MINLIPNKEKKRKNKDFYLRLLIVFFLVMGLVFLIISFLILPYFIFSLQKKNLAIEKLETQRNMPIPKFNTNTQKLINDLDFKLLLIENIQKEKFLVTEKVINEIVLNKMPDIKINKISYLDSVSKGKVVNIQGSAPSRDRLLLFRLALEDNTTFKKVDIPISNFIKGSNLQFSLDLTPI